MAQRIRRISPLQAAKVLAVLYGLLGLLFTPLFLLISFAAPDQAPFGAVVAFIFPVIYACIGFLSGLIGCAFYNLVAGWVGGFEVELV